MELKEPKPLIGPRGVVALCLGFLLTLVVLWFGAVFVQGERVLTECSTRGPGDPLSYSTETELNVLPPSWDCVWLNNRGEVLGGAGTSPRRVG